MLTFTRGQIIVTSIDILLPNQTPEGITTSDKLMLKVKMKCNREINFERVLTL